MGSRSGWCDRKPEGDQHAGPKEREDRYRRGTCQRERTDLVSSSRVSIITGILYRMVACPPATYSAFSSRVLNNDFSRPRELISRQDKRIQFWMYNHAITEIQESLWKMNVFERLDICSNLSISLLYLKNNIKIKFENFYSFR